MAALGKNAFTRSTMANGIAKLVLVYKNAGKKETRS
jgi:hypothetical protein